MARANISKVSEMNSSFKENEPPKVANRTVSVSGLFDQTHRLRQKNDEAARNPLAPRAAGVSKYRKSQPGIFAQFAKPKAQEHPVYTSFKATLSEYKEGVAETKTNGMQPVLEELIARVDGVDVNGQPLKVSGAPTSEDLKALAGLEDALSTPLDDDLLTLQGRSGAVSEVRLGDKIHSFETRSEKKRAELATLLEQLEEVDGEIADAQKDALQTEKTEVKALRDKLAANLAGFKDEALRIKQQTEAEIKEAYKVDKKFKKDFEAKIAALTE